MTNKKLITTIRLTILALSFFAVLSTTGFAMTTEHEVTLAYVRKYPNEFSVNVAKGEDGLIDFTITHDVPRPMYHVADLAIYHHGKLIARSTTPSFGKKQGNEFHFALVPEDIAESKFDLSDSALGYSDDGDTAPVPGTIIHKFRLLDFVPKKMLKPTLTIPEIKGPDLPQTK